MDMAVMLHNVRSAHNVGSVFRTSDAAGVSHIFLTGYTPTPTDRFDRTQKDIAKTALGAETWIPWTYTKQPHKSIAELREHGWRIVGVEQDARAHDYRTFSLTQPTVFVFGNEVLGLSKTLRDACDDIIEIPMHGKKESLNVAVSAGIVLFHFNT
jgi:tRNA G18 (ribose-2'-O)-methylase SpoU